MLSRSKRWYSKVLARCTGQRSLEEPCFRGHFEYLESRTVLSASFGTMEAAPRFESFAPNHDGGRPFSGAAMFASESPQHALRADRGPAGPGPFADEFGPSARFVHFGQMEPPGSYFGGQIPAAMNQQPPQIIVFNPPGPAKASSSAGGERGGGNNVSSILASIAPIQNSITEHSLAGVAPLTSALSNSLATSSDGSLSLNSAIAHEAAFQYYSSQRLLLASAATTDDEPDQSVIERGRADIESDAFEGYIKPGDESPFGTDWLWTKSLEEERRAIDEVLRRLHDPNELRDERNLGENPSDEHDSVDGLDQIGFEEQLQFDPSHSAADDGMILLQAAGDANEGDVNLMAVIDDGLEIADSLLGVEASVGIHQAFDAAVELHPPAAGAASPIEQTSPLPEKSAASGSETSTMPVAAAAAGVTTLFVVMHRKRKSGAAT